MDEKSEKIKWFEKKLNKWVKLFEESEQEGANRHNEVIGKIYEVDMQTRKESRAINEKLGKILKHGATTGIDFDKDSLEAGDSIGISDNTSNSKQTAKRLKKAKTVDRTGGKKGKMVNLVKKKE